MIDWSHVNELKNDMGDGFDEIVDVFLEEVDDGIGKLDEAATAPVLAADLHFLKGAALNLGLTQFAELCNDGEARANQGDTDGIDLDAVRQSYAASRQALLSGLRRCAA